LRINRIQIKNFRNFRNFEINFDTKDIVIVGENNVGKSNLIYALRLVLDVSLPNSMRQLEASDFWDGIEPFAGNKIVITIEFADFHEDKHEHAILGDCLIKGEDTTYSTISYVYEPKRGIDVEDETILSEDDYDYYFCCNEDINRVITDLVFQKYISFALLPALRDASSDLENSRRSPLNRIIKKLNVDKENLKTLGNEIDEIIVKILNIPSIKELQLSITDRLEKMIGDIEPVEPTLGFIPTEPDRLLRFLRLFAEGQHQRTMDEIGTGYANILYIILLLLEAKQKRELSENAAMILVVEEPEAHLHPHLQRLVFTDLFDESETNVPVLLTTHSPHITSVAPLKSLLMLQKTDAGTIGFNATDTKLTEFEIKDIERYLNVTRAELAFSKGIILVEGIAEVILVSEFAKKKGKPLDEFGISIISVEGTDFKPYIKLLGSAGLNIRTAIITDGDPITLKSGKIKKSGIKQALQVFEIMYDGKIQLISDMSDDWIVKGLAYEGIFMGNHTLEIDLFEIGYLMDYLRVFRELGKSSPTKTHNLIEISRNWKTFTPKQKTTKIVGRIKDAGGKGRFAQRLAPRITASKIPSYIEQALKYMGID
jgi:putative ATP-dependent endonuclease of the OLD family